MVAHSIRWWQLECPASLQALVDRPDEVRRIVNFKRLQLTDYKIDIPRIAKKKVLAAALEESGGPPLLPPALRGSKQGLKSCCMCHRIVICTGGIDSTCHHGGHEAQRAWG